MMDLRENSLVNRCVAVLAQGAELLEKLDDALYDALYIDTKWVPVKSGVGGHFRHCLDFYRNFLAGWKLGRVDYERRERNTQIERERLAALRQLKIIIAELAILPLDLEDTPLLINPERESNNNLLPGEISWLRSSIGRELQYLHSHTIHHYALIALLLKFQGYEPPADFGVAPSTLKHWKEEEALCVQ